MGLCPKEMEKWGAASIFKESARLLHKHYRLFLPFFLVFYLPTSLFSLLFLAPYTTPPSFTSSVVDGPANTAQITDDPLADLSFAVIFISLTLHLLNYVLEILGIGAVYYIINYLYTPTCPDDDEDDEDDGRSLVPRKVFQFLPRAFLRMFVTGLWAGLALLLCLFIALLVGVPYGIISAASGWSNLNFALLLILFASFLVLVGLTFLGIAFALAQVVATLEPGNYGREALKRSTKLVRIGRVWTIVAVTLSVGVLARVWSVPKRVTLTAWEMSVWAKVILGVGIGGLDAVFTVYSRVVAVVLYFVYKARFDAAGSAKNDLLQQMDAAEHSYEPIVEGNGSVSYLVGEG